MLSFQIDDALTIEAPAKVNIYLKVLGKRPDGYHEIESFMQKLTLCDVLQVRRQGRKIALRCSGADLPQDKGNLAFRAAYSFFAETGLAEGADIALQKNIPVAAGLGGGSSDAAAVLRALNRLHAFPLNQDRLLALGKTLGADVPFFVSDASAAWATGIGERLEERPSLAGVWLVLINPGFPVSTRWAYENLPLTTMTNPYILGAKHTSSEIHSFQSDSWIDFFYNDLESVTVERFPVLGEIKSRLLADGATGALMSGSGPTVFGVFREELAASTSWQGFAQKYGKGAILTRTRV